MVHYQAYRCDDCRQDYPADDFEVSGKCPVCGGVNIDDDAKEEDTRTVGRPRSWIVYGRKAGVLYFVSRFAHEERAKALGFWTDDADTAPKCCSYEEGIEDDINISLARFNT